MLLGELAKVGTLARITRGASRLKSRARDVSPLAARVERQGRTDDTVARLLAARRKVARGRSLTEVVADGTLSGWNLRMVLSHCAGRPLVNWDQETGRTQLERAALVERALGELTGGVQ